MLDERNVLSMSSGATDVASTLSSLYWISSAMVASGSGLIVLLEEEGEEEEEEGYCLRNKGKCDDELSRGAWGTQDVLYI